MSHHESDSEEYLEPDIGYVEMLQTGDQPRTRLLYSGLYHVPETNFLTSRGWHADEAFDHVPAVSTRQAHSPECVTPEGSANDTNEEGDDFDDQDFTCTVRRPDLPPPSVEVARDYGGTDPVYTSLALGMSCLINTSHELFTEVRRAWNYEWEHVTVYVMWTNDDGTEMEKELTYLAALADDAVQLQFQGSTDDYPCAERKALEL